MNESTEPTIESTLPPISAAMRTWLLLLTVAAMGISAFLLYASLKGGPVAGCGADSGFACDEVISGRWGKWFDLPVSGLALLIYVLAFIDVLRAGSERADTRRHAMGQLLVEAVLILAAAAWFVGLQVYEQQYCSWCLAAHGLGVVLAMSLLTVVAQRGATERPKRKIMLALACGAMLVGGQLVYQSKTMTTQQVETASGELDSGPGPDRTISILGRMVRGLKTRDYPAIGSTDAKHIIVYIFDYTCPHCRIQHQNLLQVLDRYGDDVALLLLPMPLDAKCNDNVVETEPRHEGACDIAHIAMGVWHHDRDAFVAFDKWMAEQESPTVEIARTKAVELIGDAALDQAMADIDFSDRVVRHIKLYEIASQYAGTRSVPQVIVGSIIIAGRPPGAEQLFEVLENDCGFEPPAAAIEPDSPSVATAP